ncbi:hypothetical protein L596_000835 [Steinernema carpocapsae]|uniref:HAT C-terminal dimerisation domain-containing protein n=1 Tax=Steinernema carpocapsae TaxID=34508 RepID=A0A4V6I778_STECR|nr:hypothetical protein L596_000835 [Steinernema carpocapsae]
MERQIPSASEVDLFLMDDQVTEDENFNWEPLNPTTASPTNSLDLELVGYLADDRLPAPTQNKNNSCNVMNYWMKKANKFPNISRMARKYLTTLASSAEPERIFSGLNHFLSNPKRANLKDETIERLTTVRHDNACRKLESFERQPPEKRLEIEDEANTVFVICCCYMVLGSGTRKFRVFGFRVPESFGFSGFGFVYPKVSGLGFRVRVPETFGRVTSLLCTTDEELQQAVQAFYNSLYASQAQVQSDARTEDNEDFPEVMQVEVEKTLKKRKKMKAQATTGSPPRCFLSSHPLFAVVQKLPF